MPEISDWTRYRRKRGDSLRIFLSHSGQEQLAAADVNLRLTKKLAYRNIRAEVFNTSLDSYRFAPGAKLWMSDDEELRAYLRQHLSNCDAYLLLVMGSGIDERNWVMWEMREASRLSLDLSVDRRPLFLPCVLGPPTGVLNADLVAEFFSNREVFDMSTPLGFDRLVDVLALAFGSRYVVPPEPADS